MESIQMSVGYESTHWCRLVREGKRIDVSSSLKFREFKNKKLVEEWI